MSIRLLILVGCVLALAYGPVSGQSSSSGKANKPPTEIGGKSLEQWIKEIKHSDPSVRETAMRAVPYFGPAAKAAVPSLLTILKNDTDASCRVHAAISMYMLAEYVEGEEATKAVEVLRAKLDYDPQAIVRFHAVIAVGAFETKATAAIPNLVNRIHDSNSWELRRAVVGALAAIATDKKFGPDGRAVTAIANLLLNKEEKSGQVRLEAVMSLGGMGRPTQEKEFLLAKQALVGSLKDADKPVRIWARVSLMAIDQVTDDGLKEVAGYLKDKDVMARVQAARALAAMGKEAKSKIPDVTELLEDKDPLAVSAAIDALGTFGPLASSAVPALQQLLEKKDYQTDYFKQAVKYAIEQINGRKK
jgi:HEAT repeat protein